MHPSGICISGKLTSTALLWVRAYAILYASRRQEVRFICGWGVEGVREKLLSSRIFIFYSSLMQ